MKLRNWFYRHVSQAMLCCADDEEVCSSHIGLHNRRHHNYLQIYIYLKKNDWVKKKNNVETDEEENKKLAGSLATKKLLSEECTGRNSERVKSSGQKRISDDRRRRIRRKSWELGECWACSEGHSTEKKERMNGQTNLEGKNDDDDYKATMTETTMTMAMMMVTFNDHNNNVDENEEKKVKMIMLLALQRLGEENPDDKLPGPPGWGLITGPTTLYRKTKNVENPHESRSRMDKWERPMDRNGLMQMATWNVRSLLQPEASRALEQVLVKYKVDILALQEIRWRTMEVVKLKKYTLFNSGSKENRRGTGFIVRNRIKSSVMGYRPVNDRICLLRMKGKFFNILVYMPQLKMLLKKEKTLSMGNLKEPMIRYKTWRENGAGRLQCEDW
ncbi:hypothetical protein ANN_01424 [Periplaneta americana]|uniref:Endonuclease/exonuclease/phosphatase domain-containing protein n=1 Tax=Periplaneta americana TaxID=6978 RepID=A0ABQ8TWF6_PERAM|nr:hypothetical protein ANN_01424 [Periplaneta americana]